jgi:small subunit ribosomal protein S3
MSHKIHPDSMRIARTGGWRSRWYTDNKALYRQQLLQDIMIREYIRSKLSIAGLDEIEISRTSNLVNINVFVARPGVAIGRGGGGIDIIKKELSRKCKGEIDIKINEVKKPDMSAHVIARNIVEGMERRKSPKKLMLTEKDKAMAAGAKGVKIWISGTFGVPKQSRIIKLEEGIVPLQTIRADIDFAMDTAAVRSAGNHGIKVWVYREKEQK